jgi:hypothetical protein
MTVSVDPGTFVLVLFDGADIARVADELLGRLGIANDLHITVDETTPVARIRAEDGDPIEVHAESGAFEDPRRPRHLSEQSTATSLARVLYRLRDRRESGFASAPPDAELTLPQIAAWDVYAMGRFGRLGYNVHEPRWLYNFRNRHGFSDASDAVFSRLWMSDQMTWGELEEAGHAAIAATAAV